MPKISFLSTKEVAEPCGTIRRLDILEKFSAESAATAEDGVGSSSR
jgi:hypothetical protein